MNEENKVLTTINVHTKDHAEGLSFIVPVDEVNTFIDEFEDRPEGSTFDTMVKAGNYAMTLDDAKDEWTSDDNIADFTVHGIPDDKPDTIEVAQIPMSVTQKQIIDSAYAEH